VPDLTAIDRDELGLVRAIAVKERSSSQRKELFKSIQLRDGLSGETNQQLQLILDMPVRWGSTHAMLNRAFALRKAVDVFVYELGIKTEDLTKRQKIDALKLTKDEWRRVRAFRSLLSHADTAQKAFSSESIPALFNALPAIERLHTEWSERLKKADYMPFAQALRAGLKKIEEYYQKTADSDAHIITMILHPVKKMRHFKDNWDEEAQGSVLEIAQRVFRERYEQISTTSLNSHVTSKPRKCRRQWSDSDTDWSSSESDTEISHAGDANTTWEGAFNLYLKTPDILPEGMTVVTWWGINASRYHSVWASLARDYLAIMASSVSSERAFSSAGITISKRRNRLKGDIVEALQCLKCMYSNDLIFRKVTTLEVEEDELDADDGLLPLPKSDGGALGGGENGFSWDQLLDDNNNSIDIE
ncbi:hypothetical protein M378DRAFT_1028731, partial [Amanita muscaria Koide BX008]